MLNVYSSDGINRSIWIDGELIKLNVYSSGAVLSH